MKFNPRAFLFHVTASVARQFLEFVGVQMESTFDWTLGPRALAKAIQDHIERKSPELWSEVSARLADASDLADDAGYYAVLNAARPSERIAEELATTQSTHDRALLVYCRFTDLFRRAIAIRFFDDAANRSASQRVSLNESVSLPDGPIDASAFAAAIATFVSAREGTGRRFEVEQMPRYADNTLQLSVYVEGPVDTRQEFGEHGLDRYTRKPAVELALVFDAKRGIIETVARGGLPYHDELQRAFVKHILLREIGTSPLPKQVIDLALLQHGIRFEAAANDGGVTFRLKSIELQPQDNSPARVIVVAESKDHAEGAESLARRWLRPEYAGSRIVGAKIALQFEQQSRRGRRRTLYIGFRRNGTISWDRVSATERELVYRFLERSGLIPAGLEPRAA